MAKTMVSGEAFPFHSHPNSKVHRGWVLGPGFTRGAPKVIHGALTHGDVETLGMARKFHVDRTY